MLIQGSVNTDKSRILADKYSELINSGVSADSILVIALNPYKKEKFIEVIKNNENLGKSKIYTFFGLCYNAFIDNWDYISKLIHSEDVTLKPNLCGLEVSQYIFKQCIREADFSDYISKVNLLHQMFRRYSLIVQNALSPSEIIQRSRILNHTFASEAQKCIEEYKRKTIEYKSFDYLRQMAILPEIYKKTDYFKGIKYLLVDDADEMPYAFWQFVDGIMSNLEDYFIAYDLNGSSRCGYLGAYKLGIDDFKQKYSPTEIVLDSKHKNSGFINSFSNAIRTSIKVNIDDFEVVSKVKRLDMFDSVVKDISKLIKSGIKEEDICVVSPLCDDVLTNSFLKNNFGIKFSVLSGSEKLVDNYTVQYILCILKMSYGLKLKDYELKRLFVNLFKIPYKKCYCIIKKYLENGEIGLASENVLPIIKLISVLNSLKKATYSLAERIKIIKENILAEFSTDFDNTKYDFLLKEAQSFEYAFGVCRERIGEEFAVQIENSLISENPSQTFNLVRNSVIIATPQKIIDYSIKTKYQFLLDISSSEWLKEDTGTLYDAWVFSRDWSENQYTLEDRIRLTRDKAARMLRKLLLCAQDKIKFYSSLYDNLNNENFGGLTDFIKKDESTKKTFNIVPREDQKAVLEYQKGKMGIMAVPGAGKTTILLALIIKLIEKGASPENIFVLTYMESAAKNFKERIKSVLSDTPETPNISTIHGLALRIIKENANYSKVGLDENFEICDDTQKEKIIKELFYKLKIDEDKFDNYLRCISIVKLSENNDELWSKFKDIQDFYRFYEQYCKTLKYHNLIDYDDMLAFAVKILEQNKSVLDYYQNLCKYIIEDEAQDSTDIQQKLISLLSGKYQNVVRCGDINQSITSTFTNSNIEGFKNFLKDSNKVEMNSSQRCAKPVYSLANELIKESLSDEVKKDAFYSIEMVPTKNNPQTSIKPEFSVFESQEDEKDFILNKIKGIYSSSPNASIAILLRLNSQVNAYNEFFLSNGIQTQIRTDSLSQKKMYAIINSVLKVIESPFANKNVIELAQIYKNEKIADVSEDDAAFIKESDKPFIEQDIDKFNSQGLLQLYWDIDYWLNLSSNSIENTALSIGLYYAKNSVEKSNTYIISNIIRRLCVDSENLSDILKKLEYLANKPLSANKFFDEENIDGEAKLNIMTVHKSKGDEFDYVFIPQMNEDNYALSIENVKIKSGGHFVQTIKSDVDGTALKTPELLKKELVHETLRLLYVGITRAKLGLYFTDSLTKKNKKSRTCEFIHSIMESNLN